MGSGLFDDEKRLLYSDYRGIEELVIGELEFREGNKQVWRLFGRLFIE
jgi:hypothetical protein